jgi:hypothetical protein
MARVWTCAGCKARWPRTKQRCTCGRKRPAARRAAHLKVLDELPYSWWTERYGEVCGICGRPPKDEKKLHRDHDHRTGEPRGLLCFQCNRGLPNYVTAEWLDRARAYVGRAA